MVFDSREQLMHATRIRATVREIATSGVLLRSPKLGEFLRFITEETLAGRGAQLNQHLIAQSVYQRDASFDPKTDATIRVEANRLRRRLALYHETAPVEIVVELPAGTYQPAFRWRDREAVPSDVGAPFEVAVRMFACAEDEAFAEDFTDDLTLYLARSEWFHMLPPSVARRSPETASCVVEGSIAEDEGVRKVRAVVRDLRSAEVHTQPAVVAPPGGAPSVAAREASAVYRTTIEALARGARDAEALQLYRQGLSFQAQFTVPALERATECFEAAAARDPAFAVALASLAEHYTHRILFRAPAIEYAQRARAAAEAALRREPRCWQALLALGVAALCEQWDFANGMRLLRQAYEIAPEAVGANVWWVLANVANGSIEEADRAARRAAEIWPGDARLMTHLSFVQSAQLRMADAKRIAAEGIEIDPSFPPLHLHYNALLIATGQTTEAARMMERFCAHWTAENLALGIWAHCAARAGDAETALHLVERIKTSDSADRAMPLAIAMAGLGERQRMYEALAAALELRDPLCLTLHLYPYFFAYRGQAPFRTLLRTIGVPGAVLLAY